MTIKRCSPKLEVKADEKGVSLFISLDLFCNETDETASFSDANNQKNNRIPESILKKAEENFTDSFKNLVSVMKETGCDFLGVKEKIYRYNHRYYDRYKDSYLSDLNTYIKVTVEGQK